MSFSYLAKCATRNFKKINYSFEWSHLLRIKKRGLILNTNMIYVIFYWNNKKERTIDYSTCNVLLRLVAQGVYAVLIGSRSTGTPTLYFTWCFVALNPVFGISTLL